MGQHVEALIEHRLTTESILELPGKLKQLTVEGLVGHWKWSSPGMSEAHDPLHKF